MHSSIVLYLAFAFVSIHIVQAANPTGGTGCSKRWVIDHWCWRYCDETGTSWCYTGNGCANNEEVCATRSVCQGWCKDSQIGEGCVKACPDRSRGK